MRAPSDDHHTPSTALRTPLLIIGASGHARVVVDILEQQGAYHIAGVLDARGRSGETFENYDILGSDEDVARCCNRLGVHHVLVAIGDNWTRGRVAGRVRSAVPQVVFATAVHPEAVVAGSAIIAAGAVVMAGAVVNANARIGDHCIVNSGAIVDHDSVLEDCASIAPGAVLGGNVSIGAFSAVSIGATVIHCRTVGEHTVIGAGAVVVRDVPKQSVAYGVPARVVRARERGDPYL